MKKNRFYLLILAWFFLISSVGEMAWCGDYPDKPVNMIVAYELGALTDMESRMMMSVAQEKQYLGQRVNIVNKRPSLRGKTGWNWCKGDSCTDGYTMMGYKLPHFMARSIMFKNQSDFSDCEPLANWSREPAAFIVPINSRFQTLGELIAYGKENPGKVTVSGAGRYVGHHIAMLQLQKAAGIQLTYIPEASGMAAKNSVIIETVTAGFNDLSASLRSLNRVRILAIADCQRSPRSPDVPTFLELGIGVDDLSVCYRGVAFPKGVSTKALAVCQTVFPHMLKDPRLTHALKTVESQGKIMNHKEIVHLFDQTRKRLELILKDE